MNRDPRGYYAALNVAPDATAAELQHAFRTLMRLCHPDVDPSVAGGGGEEARRILEAYSVLRDPASRAEYDPADPSSGVVSPAPGARDIPVRHHRAADPVLRVTPVRWERGPL